MGRGVICIALYVSSKTQLGPQRVLELDSRSFFFTLSMLGKGSKFLRPLSLPNHLVIVLGNLLCLSLCLKLIAKRDWGVNNGKSSKSENSAPSLSRTCGVQPHLHYSWISDLGGQMLYPSELQKSSGLPLPAECLRQSTEGSLLRKKMIRSNLLRDRGCIFSCQQLMKQECQLTGESKSGQKKGEKKICSSPLKSICFNWGLWWEEKVYGSDRWLKRKKELNF